LWKEAVNNRALDHHAATACPNCAAAVAGNFCHECGQETVLHPASTREFVHEFIGHYVALEGKLWKSLWLLLFRPGRLTLEYIKGRRVRYVQPLRLYLTFSLIFFALMKYDGQHELQVGAGKKTPAAPAAHASQSSEPASSPASAKPASAAPAAKTRKGDEAGIIQEDDPDELRDGTKGVREWVAGYSPHIAEKMGEFIDMPKEEKEHALTSAFYAYVPYAVFFMMPLFALYLKVLYLGSGKRFGEHLLFALHANAFAFVAMTLMQLARHVLNFWLIKTLFVLWLAFYLPVAMRHVYGGGRILTGLRWIVLMLLHLLGMSLAVAAAVAFGIVH
jgi:hypothetical protein